ncbi:MAG: PKD domain-containing protein [Bacteroidia bacterium]
MFILLSFPSCLLAQEGNVWIFGSKNGLDFNTEPPTVITNGASLGTASCASYCDSLGRLLFYCLDDSIYNRNHQFIPDGKFGQESGSYSQAAIILPVVGQPSLYYLFLVDNILGGVGVKKDGATYSVIDMRLNNGLGGIATKEVPFFKKTCHKITAIQHVNQKDYWVITRSGDSLFAFPITEAGIGSPVTSYMPALEGIGNIKASRDGKILIECSSTFDSFVYIYDFDPGSGVFSNQSILEQFIREFNQETLFRYQDATFSPNDSLLYIVGYGHDNKGQVYSSNRQPLAQYQRYAPDIKSTRHWVFPPANDGFASLQLAPNGKIYVNPIGHDHMAVIHSPDSIGEAMQLEFQYIDYPQNQYSRFAFPNIINAYKSVKFRYTQNCSYRYQNVSDTQFFSTYTWFFADHFTGITDSVEGFAPSYQFSRTGKYLVKLRATTPAGYNQWYSDSVLFISRPQATFTTEDTTGCQWLGFRFADASTTDTLDTTRGESWLWHFGDGTTGTEQNPTHIYTENGSYTVSLIYNNGFCSDTITRKQVVEILPAPKPGFSLSAASGCAPFTAQVTDQSQGQVTHYTYYYGHLTGLHIPDPEISFPEPGDFWVHQILLSPTGCITQDSVAVDVSDGFSENDSIHTVVATVTASQHVSLQWQPHPLARLYQVFRLDDGTFTELAKTSFTDYTDHGAPVAAQPVTYRITASDSCGKQSSAGRVATTIHLSGTSHGNEFNLIRFSAYEEWPNGVGHYTIEIQQPEGTFDSVASMPQPVADYKLDFTPTNGQYQTCYRIKAVKKEGNFVSLSNRLCLPYQPTVWVPTAFSPNGDGYNDTFSATAIGIHSFKMEIYTRWGEQVFSSGDLNQSWDGSINGKPAQAGVYLYKLRVFGSDNKYTESEGTLLLVK